MSSPFNKHELHHILCEMVEQVGVEALFEELIQGMNQDELYEHVELLDQYLFANHFLTRET
jgi:hypothetical protein